MGSQCDSRPLSLGKDRIGGGEGSDSSWLLARVMTVICCKDSNEIKHGECFVLSKHLSAGGYNYYYYSLHGCGLGRAGTDTSGDVLSAPFLKMLIGLPRCWGNGGAPYLWSKDN